MRLSLFAVAFILAAASASLAGPPFVTDDPEPVELHHWEVYIGSHLEHDATGNSGTLPHVEVNFGAAPNLQLHVIAPCSFVKTPGGVGRFGYGDTELGVKYRFVQETSSRPMVGVFPQLEVPTGSQGKGLGSGHLQVLLPVWLQKSSRAWTTYGGGGYFINPGSGNHDYWLLGWEIQRDFGERLTLGGELFGTTPTQDGGSGSINFNLGGQINLDDRHHILFSAGRGIHGDLTWMSYLAFQWTFGPGRT